MELQLLLLMKVLQDIHTYIHTHKLSATNRAIIYEVGDLHDDDAVSYLVRNGVDESLAKKLVDCIGGRMVHLGAVFTYWGRTRQMKGLNRSTRTSKKDYFQEC